MPGLAFRVFQTPHFRVVYQAGTDSLALRAAGVAEAALPFLKEDLLPGPAVPLPRITLVLTDVDHESNGFSGPMGHVIQIFAYPMVQKSTGSLQWMDRVVVHELAHQVTYAALRRGLGIYGELWRLIFIPAWFMEGIAQFEAEEWDKNREFLLKAGANKRLLLDRKQLYGFMEGNAVESRLLYEQGHSLYRFIAERHGKDVGGRVLGNIGLLRPGFNTALKGVTGKTEGLWISQWRESVEEQYGLGGAENRLPGYAGETSGPVAGIMEQVYSLKSAGNGMVFTGIERIEAFERNLYYYSRGGGLVRLDGPDVEPFFCLSGDQGRVYYSRLVRTGSGALRNRLFTADLEGRVRALNGLEGEEPCLLPGGKLAFVKFRGSFSGLCVADLSGANEKRLPLPDSVMNVFKPVCARDRLYFSIMEMSGARKIASLAPDGSGYRVEVEKAGADVRYPAVNEEGTLAYVSNEAGPFNVFVRDAAGGSRQVTADPYGVFAPDFNGAGDSIFVIGLSDEARNFNLSCFSVPLSGSRKGGAWDTAVGWKKIKALDRGLIEKELAEEDITARPIDYFSPEETRPLVFYPYFKGFDPGSLDLTKPGLKIALSDPLEKQAIVAGVTDQLRNHKAGFELSYENRCLWPTFFLGLSRDYAFSDSSADDFYLFEAEKTDDFTAGLSCPVDVFKNPRFSQHVSVSGTFLERRWRDSLYSAGDDVVWESGARREVPLSLGYGFFSYRTFTGNLIHPLDAFAVSAVFTAASRDWGSDVRYRAASLHLRKSAEIGRTFQTVFLRAHLVNQFDGSDTYIRISGGDLPRGRDVLREYRSQRYASLTAEYRLPVVKELRFSLLGLYFGRLTVGPFFDFLAWNEPGVAASRARENLLSEKTAGIQLRQRLFFLGHSFMDLGFFWAYDGNRDEPHVFSRNAGAGF